MQTEKENTLIINKHLLLCININALSLSQKKINDLTYVKQNFCGIVFDELETFHEHSIEPGTLIYVCGDIGKLSLISHIDNINNINHNNIFIVKELSINFTNFTNQIDNSSTYKIVYLDQVPLNINNVGVYFRNFFDHNNNNDYFNLIENQHKFQTLTESTKPGQAFRTGIYLTKVEQIKNAECDAEDMEIKFKLLRCSSNLNGPTDNFREVDIDIISQVNDKVQYFFEENTELNHVLAQIYENRSLDVDNKKVEKKAKIKKHSDKTKDMPRNGLMAFCTFYKNYSGDVNTLTNLRFELKSTINSNLESKNSNQIVKKKFNVPLYPNSVFIMSLSANRMYTHEIIPSKLPIAQLPTRMGYVIRCSNTDAIFKNGSTYIIGNNNTTIKLVDPDTIGVNKLKDLYYKENTTDELITYDKFYFSLNKGDYERPLL